MTEKDLLIAIDGNEANVKNRVGSNIYAFELLKQLYQMQNAKCKSQNCKSKFKIFLKESPLDDLPKSADCWQYEVFGPKVFWTKLSLPFKLMTNKPKPDVFFTPGHYAPCWAPCSIVISIMDLSYLYFPQMFKKRDLWQLRTWTAASIKKAKKILTISESSKNAIIDHYQVEPKKVVVTYPGVKLKAQMSKCKTITQSSKLKTKYGIESDYLLYVGTLQPRKNLIRLIEAFNRTIEQSNNRTMKLVIVGKKGWLYDEIFSKVKELGLEKKVIFTGFVPDEELPAFYQGAQCFVLPSLYEGFGIPALEAMAYGCPVVASNVSSLPEVIGEAGIFVNPESIESIAQGIEKVLKLKPSEREKLVKRGKEQVKKFTWQKCAKETLKVLKEIASV